MPKPLAITLSLLAVVAVAGLTWWFLTAQQAGAPATTDTAVNQPSNSTDTGRQAAAMEIIFTDRGFQRPSYVMRAGQTVTIRNDSSMAFQFSSDEHPAHTDNPELNLRLLQPGQQATLTPKVTGTWGVHDHEHPEFTSTLAVTN